MSLFEELRKGPEAQARITDYLRWIALVVLMAIALVFAVVMGILLISGDSAADAIEYVFHHLYIHYGLIPVLILLLVVIAAGVAFVLQLAMTYVVYWKAYSEKRGEKGEGGARPALLAASEKKTGWTRGYYQGVVLLVTNAVIAVLIVAGIVYAFGYIGIEVAEQPGFCLMCHEVMHKPYESYAASTHKGIHCGACHNDPGIEGFVKGEVIAPMKEGWLQAADEYHLDEHGHLLPGAVPINNESCLSKECHKEERLRQEEFHYKGFVFRHDKHLDQKHGGQVLTCDACHAYDKQVHMKVDNNTCGLCHFSEKKLIKEPACEACHALRTRLKDEAKELMHAQAADFEKQPCNDCHTALRSPLILKEEACGKKCHHRHGKEMKLSEVEGGTEEVHKTHVHAGCMTCHERAHHKIDHTKFTTARMVTFGKEFTHEKHGQDCHECHARIGKRFALKLKDKYDCSSCHHDGVDDPDSCDSDTCHDLKKTEAFGRRFPHKPHGGDCSQCHVDGAKNLRLKLRGRADCNACHHEGVEDPEMCAGCHESQDEFFKGTEKFGFEETPSTKAVAEMGCDTCHGDVQKYEPGQCRESCTNCHDAGDVDYDYSKLTKKGKLSIEELVASLKTAEVEISAAADKGITAEQVARARNSVAEARKMLSFLRKDASYGIHNPGLFGEYNSKIRELLEGIKKLLEEPGDREK